MFLRKTIASVTLSLLLISAAFQLKGENTSQPSFSQSAYRKFATGFFAVLTGFFGYQSYQGLRNINNCLNIPVDLEPLIPCAPSGNEKTGAKYFAIKPGPTGMEYHDTDHRGNFLTGRRRLNHYKSLPLTTVLGSTWVNKIKNNVLKIATFIPLTIGSGFLTAQSTRKLIIQRHLNTARPTSYTSAPKQSQT